MNLRPSLVFLSSIAAPHQIKLCDALQEYLDASFWFYESPTRTRGALWQTDLGKNCRILNPVWFREGGPLTGRYLAIGLRSDLQLYDPDIVMVGGFTIPSNYIAYRWARANRRQTVVFTEPSRDSDGNPRKRSVMRLIRWLYRHVDLVIVSSDDAVAQFRDDFGFGDKVVAGRYAADLKAYFGHPIRHPKPAYTYLFANRLTSIYNPLGAIDVFSAVLNRHPGSRLLVNASGELLDSCRSRITSLGIEDDVEFLTDIGSWDDLPDVYERSDVLVFPARFSVGNFTILEAMASGMGIVISDRILGVGELIKDGHNGFRCEPTSDAFLDRIERYVQHPLLLGRHAKINRDLVKPLSTEGTASFLAELLRSRLPDADSLHGC